MCEILYGTPVCVRACVRACVCVSVWPVTTTERICLFAFTDKVDVCVFVHVYVCVRLCWWHVTQ